MAKARPRSQTAGKTKAAKASRKTDALDAVLPGPVAEISADEIVLTRDGYERIREELHYLTTVQRPQIMEQLRESRQMAQSSEDSDTSEYENAKIEQARVEGRIQELKAILLRSRVLDPKEIPTSYVGIGSKVRLKHKQTGEMLEFTIVGPVEADPELGKISHESPVGRALMGKKERSEAEVVTPGGRVAYRILRIAK